MIIGIDGATFKMIKPMVNEGKLPTIKKIMDSGSYCELFSTRPSVTCVAWPALFTGKNPKNNGIIDWHYYRSNYTEHFFNGIDIKGKKFWDYLGENGVKCGVVNVPITYPPTKVNGFIITGCLTPGEYVEFTYPKSLRSEILSKNYQIDPININEPNNKVFFDQVVNVEEIRKKVCVELIKTKKWDMFFVVFRPEPLQNRFWEKNTMNIIEDVYKKVDKQVADLIDSINGEFDVMLVSDHGFGMTPDYNFYLNVLLDREGYLFLNKKKMPIDKVYRILVKFGLRWIKYFVGSKIRKSRFINYAEEVNWNKTKAFGRVSEETGFIYLNKVGRFDKGIVIEEDVEKLKKEIKNKLDNLYHNKMKVINKVWFREELFGNLKIAPDIIFELNEKFKGLEIIGSNSFAKINDKDKKAWHEFEGIFIASGPNIKNLGEIKQAEIIDVAPTILKLYDIKKPEEMDGKIINLIKDKFKHQKSNIFVA